LEQGQHVGGFRVHASLHRIFVVRVIEKATIWILVGGVHWGDVLVRILGWSFLSFCLGVFWFVRNENTWIICHDTSNPTWIVNIWINSRSLFWLNRTKIPVIFYRDWVYDIVIVINTSSFFPQSLTPCKNHKRLCCSTWNLQNSFFLNQLKYWKCIKILRK
jgi:hypothetical protein